MLAGGRLFSFFCAGQARNGGILSYPPAKTQQKGQKVYRGVAGASMEARV